MVRTREGSRRNAASAVQNGKLSLDWPMPLTPDTNLWAAWQLLLLPLAAASSVLLQVGACTTGNPPCQVQGTYKVFGWSCAAYRGRGSCRRRGILSFQSSQRVEEDAKYASKK